MDLWGEIVALGLDAVVFGICSKLYLKYSYNINVVERAQRLGVNPDINKLDNEARKYIIVQGEIKSSGKPIRSLNSPDVTGVIQKLTIKEHAIARNASGFWADQKNIIQEAFNVVPFFIKRGKLEIEILDPLSAEVLDLDTIHDKFESSSLSLMDHLVGFFNGVRQRGVETTEEFMKEGSVITAIGEVTEGSESRLQLSPSSAGYPYYLTSMPVASLLRKLEEQRVTFKWLALLFGGIGIVLTTIYVKRWWELRQARLRDEEVKRRLEKTRRERRRNARDMEEDLSESQRCVVCRVNPKEIIVLPCGHVSLCEDCSLNITSDCPVCRSPIGSKAAAFIT